MDYVDSGEGRKRAVHSIVQLDLLLQLTQQWFLFVRFITNLLLKISTKPIKLKCLLLCVTVIQRERSHNVFRFLYSHCSAVVYL